MIFLFLTIALLLLFGILLQYILMYIWTKKLEKEKCDCSNLWHRKIINRLSITLFISLIINIILCKIKENPLINNFKIISGPILSLILIVYFFILLDYITELKKKECKCSEDWKRDYGFIFTIVYLVMILLLPIIFLYIFLINKN